MKSAMPFLLLSIILNFPLKAQQPRELEIPDINWQLWDTFYGDSIRKMAFYYSLSTDNSLEIKYADQIKILDIDGVAPPDLIYFSTDSSYFEIYINENYVLKSSLHVSAIITELLRKSPMSPLYILTAKFDSLSYAYEINTYSPFIESGNLTYEIQRTEILQKGIMDIYGNMPPSKFKVIMNTPLVVGPGLRQLIRQLTVGELGYAVASVETKPGEHWWKVFIQEPEYKWRMGWLRRANVQILYAN